MPVFRQECPDDACRAGRLPRDHCSRPGKPDPGRPRRQLTRHRPPGQRRPAGGRRCRWTRSAHDGCTSATGRLTTPSITISKPDVRQRTEAEARYAKASHGVMDFTKVTYRSSVGDMDIPAYLFQPLKKRGAKGHAAMVWVHGGVHGNWGITMLPFVKEAVDRGYVVICPEYRGSTGYGESALQGHRLRRLRSGRHDERRRVPEDAAARRSGPARASWAGATAATSRCFRSSATSRHSRPRPRWCR